MAIETTIYSPRTLGKLITRMPPVHTFFRDTLFKNRRTFPTKSVDVDFKKGSRALAPFVHPKVGGKVVPNSGYQTKTYTPVLLAPDKITTVDDLLNRSAGENPYSGRTPAERAVEKLADDLRELNEMIVRREEWMAATAIFTGQIPIIGEGLNEVIDFDFTNKETIVSAEKKWNADTSDPLGDLERWREAVQKEGFVNCNICIMAKDVANAFVNNAKVKSVLDVRAYDLAVIKPRELPNGLTYIGTIHISFIIDPNVVTATKKDIADHDASKTAHAAEFEKKADVTDLNAHANNTDIHVNPSTMGNYDTAISGLIEHKEDTKIHVTAEEKASWTEGAEQAAADANRVTEALNAIAGIESRVSRVEDGLFNNITGNPFLASFDSLDGITLVKGIWNEERKRIEC